MKRLFISFLFISICNLSLLAQNQKVFKIDYRTNIEGLDTVAQKSPEDYFLRAWVNDSFIRITANESVIKSQVVNKKTNSSFILFPRSTEYYILSEGNEDGESLEEEDELNIEYVSGKSKSIAGIQCKLAIIKIVSELEGIENYDIEIWYTDKIPVLYWNEFAFLKKLPGAAMEMKVNGNGFIAEKVSEETMAISNFEIPSSYSELVVENIEEDVLDVDSSISVGSQLGEDRFTYYDEANELMGLTDEHDKHITEPIYDYFDQFLGGISTVINAESKYGSMDKNGNIIIPFKYDFLAYDDEYKQYIYSENDKFGILSANDKPIIKAQYDMLSHMSNGYLTATLGEKTGILDKSGKIVVPITYPLILEFNSEVFVTANENHYQLYNIKQNKLIADGYNLISLSEKDPIHLVQKGDKFGYINNEGKLIIPIKFNSATTFDEGTASVTDSEDGDVYFINSKGEKVEIH